MLIQAPNVLLLDEPTNDLDVQTLSVLEDLLEDFRGCVVVVSHDRYFLDRTVDRLFCFEAGRLERFEGNYSAFLDHRREQEKVAADQASRSRTNESGKKKTSPKPAMAHDGAVSRVEGTGVAGTRVAQDGATQNRA